METLRIEPDLLELSTLSFFLHGEDMNTLIHCSSWIYHSVSENFIQERFRCPHFENLANACKTGQYQIAQLMIVNGANYFNRGLYKACRSGNLELAQLMITKGANNFHRGLYGACCSGNLEIVQLLITKGANNYDGGLHAACRSGSLGIAQLMIAKGANDFNHGLREACDSENLPLIQLMLSHGANLKVLNRYPKIKQRLHDAQNIH